MVVTGSHIRRDTFSSSSPVAVVDRAAIDGIGTVNVAELVNRLPGVVGDVTGSSSAVDDATDSGLNTTALRNLGSSRTLVLVNGRRYVSGMAPGAGYGVDLNTLPVGIIERIDVLTGGQSAVYGSDGVAGVINIVTRQDFEGLSVSAQFGDSGSGGRDKQDVSLTAGRNFEGGNAWLSAGYSDDGGLMARDRHFSRVHNSQADTDGDGLLDGLRYIGSSHIPTARVDSFKGDGSGFSRRDFTLANSDAFNFADYRSLIIPLERRFAATGLRFDLDERSTLTLEANYARVESRARFEPIPLDTRNNIFEVSRGGTTGMNLDPALGPVHPLFDGTALQASLLGKGVRHLDDASLTFRRLVEFGDRGSGNVRSTFRVAGAYDHEIGERLSLSVSATYGLTDQNQTDFGDINLERARHALNIEAHGGGYRCVDEIARIDGCVPFNPFNIGDPAQDPLGIGISPAAVDYLHAEVGLESTVEQFVANAILSGDLPLAVGGGDVGFAAGLEWREEKGSDKPDPLRQKGIARGFLIKPTRGSFDVVEAFGELRVPLHEKLTLDLALRVGDYSSVGANTTWKVGVDAPVSDSLRFRAAQSRAVRAPNVADLYAGGTGTAGQVIDPCDGLTNADAGAVADNCRSIPAIQRRIDAEGVFRLTQVEQQNTLGLLGGNPDVDEETADSTTVGVVFTPAAVPGLALALDWYDIAIDDAIARTDRTTIMERCYGAASGFDPACGGQVRRDIRSGAALDVHAFSNNENDIRTSGLDVEVSYAAELGAGSLALGLSANYLNEYEIVGIVGGDRQDRTGEVLYPDLRFTLNASYTLNRANLYWQLRYWDGTRFENGATGRTDAFNSFGARVYNDLRLGYRVGESLELYLGGNNLLDEDPPLMGERPPYGQKCCNSNGTAYDLTGRQWYAGIRWGL